MDIVFDNISTLLLFTILFLVVYAALLNIYFIHKNGFHVGVNCWFCNKNSKVLFSQRNSFECPFCCQYNGFDKDGGYNKVIEAQHNVSFNTRWVVSNRNSGHSGPKSSNGLCNKCNRNQELRVLQLANYEPLDSRNYDKEVKHFEEQLEKSYQLCKTCSQIVKSAVRKQNSWIFGNKIKSLRHLNYLNSSKLSREFLGVGNFYSRLSIIRLILLMLSFLNLGVLCGLHVFDNVEVKQILPKNVILSNIYLSVYNFSVTNFGPKNVLISFFNSSKFKKSSNWHASILGLPIELLYSFVETDYKLVSKVNKVFSWIILGLVSSFNFSNEISLYFRTLEIFCSLYLIYVYSSTCVEPNSNKPKKFNLKRIKRRFENEDISGNEESDSESINSSRGSYKTVINKHSPFTASSFKNLNRSFGSVRARDFTCNTLIDDDLRCTKGIKLNEHFNDLNISAFNSDTLRNHKRTASPNPFLNTSMGPQPLVSLYNHGSTYNIPNSPFSNQPYRRSHIVSQNTKQNLDFNGSGSGQTTHFLNQPRSASPMSVKSHQSFTQSRSCNLGNAFGNTGFDLLSQPTTSFSPRDTSSVISQRVQKSFSPISKESWLNKESQPLSSSHILERPTRSLLSPSKLTNHYSLHSDVRQSDNLSMSFHNDSVPNSGLWPKLNSSHMHQRVVVNTVPNIQFNSPLNGSLVRECDKSNNSRSSSTSSGFVSNGDFNKGISKSLPTSRDNSPERISLLSEPIYK